MRVTRSVLCRLPLAALCALVVAIGGCTGPETPPEYGETGMETEISQSYAGMTYTVPRDMETGTLEALSGNAFDD